MVMVSAERVGMWDWENMKRVSGRLERTLDRMSREVTGTEMRERVVRVFRCAEEAKEERPWEVTPGRLARRREVNGRRAWRVESLKSSESKDETER